MVTHSDMNVGRGERALVVVSNRLPVDRVIDADGTERWRTSPGGLVTAMESVVSELGCDWVGWPGSVDEELEPFQIGGMRLHPVSLTETEVTEYYEGFSNDTVWPLYHDVISPPAYHREWWDTYRSVNQRFAEAVAEIAAPGAIVWVHDYQLQLVPAILRELRPDLVIGFFMHIPFPAYGIFSQLPWRRKVLEGLLGADVIGFQRVADAANFRAAVRRVVGAPSHGNMVLLRSARGHEERRVLVQEFAISIDAKSFDALARTEAAQRRAAEIREELGNPGRIILGVDRLDYTKGIRHRLKALSELWRDGDFEPGEVTLVQVASPSRERVEAYRHLRDEIEMTVSRINGDYGTIGHTPVVYLHQGFPREEMVALYLAADVMAVTALRDGMNLVAKEYAACRFDEQGALVLSEFTGAADELQRALMVNPHDIDGIKEAFLRALRMPAHEQRQRMRALRRVIFRNDVASWSESFLRAAEGARDFYEDQGSTQVEPVILPANLEPALSRLAASPELLVACDFDGTLAPIVPRPEQARILPRAEHALSALQQSHGVHVALISGRSLESLGETGVTLDGRIVAGSHGAELVGLGGVDDEHGATPTAEEAARLSTLRDLLDRHVEQVEGAWIETKPLGFAVHVRAVEHKAGEQLLDAVAGEVDRLREADPAYYSRTGKKVLEFAVRDANKGAVLKRIREVLPDMPVLFIGDDVTDEDALRALVLGDVGVRVGDQPSAAEHRVRDPEAVAALLARLAELRTGAVIGSE